MFTQQLTDETTISEIPLVNNASCDFCDQDKLKVLEGNLIYDLDMDKQKVVKGDLNFDIELETIPNISVGFSGHTKYSFQSWKRLVHKSNNPSTLEVSKTRFSPTKFSSKAVDSIFLPLEIPIYKKQAIDRENLTFSFHLWGSSLAPSPNMKILALVAKGVGSQKQYSLFRE